RVGSGRAGLSGLWRDGMGPSKTEGEKQVPPPEGPVRSERDAVRVRSSANYRRPSREEGRPGAPGSASATPARQRNRQRPRTPSMAVLRPLGNLSARRGPSHHWFPGDSSRSAPSLRDGTIPGAHREMASFPLVGFSSPLVGEAGRRPVGGLLEHPLRPFSIKS